MESEAELYEEIIAACRRNWSSLPEEVKNAINAFDNSERQNRAIMNMKSPAYRTGDIVRPADGHTFLDCDGVVMDELKIVAVFNAKDRSDRLNAYTVSDIKSGMSWMVTEDEITLLRRRS